MNCKIFYTVFFLFIYSGTTAQFTGSVPLNEEMVSGRLSNGMSYYILHNEWPKDQVSFYFVQNVGAILEEDTQDGLAHFLEHMAFNGTEHFKGKGIIDMLEKHGVRFGQEINAYTAHDETVYNLSNIPAGNKQLLDSCLLALHDWSGSLLLEEAEIDAERGVIREEWRTRRNSGFRLQAQTNKVLYKGSKYAERDVIGELEVINNFKYGELRDYYKKWYRPDLQAVIVVGDIDVKAMEKKIKERFSAIPASQNPAERYYVGIPGNDTLHYVLAKDREARQAGVTLLYKKEYPLVKDNTYQRDGLLRSLCITMLNRRYEEYIEEQETAALSLQAGITELSRLHYAFYIYAAPKEGQITGAFREALAEMERAVRYGFTESELERAKENLLSRYENHVRNQDKISNDNWAVRLKNYFLKAEPFQTLEKEFETVKNYLSALTTADVNAAIRGLQTRENRVLTVTGPDKEGMKYPGQDAYKQVMEAVQREIIASYEDVDRSQPLVSSIPDEVEATASFLTEGLAGARGYVLPNGARVVLYSTDLAEDEVLFSAFSAGGNSLVTPEDLPSAGIATSLAYNSGLGNFSKTGLQKKLAGKIARVSPYIGEYSEGLQGSGNQKDLETLLQLVYLYFEEPRFDKKAYDKLLEQYRNSLNNARVDHNKAFNDTIALLSRGYSERVRLFDEEFINDLDFEKAGAVYRDRIRNAADFTFVFVGNIGEEQLPVITSYIGNIKGNPGKRETYTNHNTAPPEKLNRRKLVRDMDVPKTTVYLRFVKDSVSYGAKERFMAHILGRLLSKRYLDTIREEEGGSYGVSVQAGLEKFPGEQFFMEIRFDCNPEMADALVQRVHGEIETIQQQPANRAYLEAVKSSLIKSREEQEKSNSFWQQALRDVLLEGREFIDNPALETLLKGITPVEIQDYAREVLSAATVVEVVMQPGT